MIGKPVFVNMKTNVTGEMEETHGWELRLRFDSGTMTGAVTTFAEGRPISVAYRSEMCQGCSGLWQRLNVFLSGRISTRFETKTL